MKFIRIHLQIELITQNPCAHVVMLWHGLKPCVFHGENINWFIFIVLNWLYGFREKIKAKLLDSLVGCACVYVCGGGWVCENMKQKETADFMHSVIIWKPLTFSTAVWKLQRRHEITDIKTMMDSWKKQNDVWLLLHYHAMDNREKYPAKKIVHKWEWKKMFMC